MNADGGGDCPEAASDAFYESIRMSWRKEAIKTVVWIADAPPRKKKYLKKICIFFLKKYSIIRLNYIRLYHILRWKINY